MAAVTLLVLGLTLLGNCATDTVRPGCRKEAAYTLARFHRDCQHDRSSGYFLIPETYKAGCTIAGDDFLSSAIPQSSGGKLTIDVPVAEVIDGITDKKSVVSIALYANEEDESHSGCGTTDVGKSYKSYLDEMASSGRRFHGVESYPGHKFKIVDFLASDDNKFKMDVFGQTDSNGKILNNIFCRQDSSSPVCVGYGPMGGGLYNYQVQIPKTYESRIFEMMDRLPKLIDKMYVSDSQKPQ